MSVIADQLRNYLKFDGVDGESKDIADLIVSNIEEKKGLTPAQAEIFARFANSGKSKQLPNDVLQALVAPKSSSMGWDNTKHVKWRDAGNGYTEVEWTYVTNGYTKIEWTYKPNPYMKIELEKMSLREVAAVAGKVETGWKIEEGVK